MNASAPATARPRPHRAVLAALPAGLLVLLLWLVHGASHALDIGLVQYGVTPRRLHGLAGVLLGPLVHADAEHLFNNSMPLLVLGWALFYFYPGVAWRVLAASWLLTGLFVWIGARPSAHIGASGVVYGLAAFLFASGVLRRQRSLMAISLLVVFLYGSLVWGLFPIVSGISWESHLWGAVVGVAVALVYRKVPPAVGAPEVAEAADEGDALEPPDAASHGKGGTHASVRPIRIVYHRDPGDEADEEELAWRRNLAEEATAFDPDSTSSTWLDDPEQRH